MRRSFLFITRSASYICEVVAYEDSEKGCVDGDVSDGADLGVYSFIIELEPVIANMGRVG